MRANALKRALVTAMTLGAAALMGVSVSAPVHAEDLIPVRSRITWGAILAGSVLALSLYFLLALLGGAVGFFGFVFDAKRAATAVS